MGAQTSTPTFPRSGLVFPSSGGPIAPFTNDGKSPLTSPVKDPLKRSNQLKSLITPSLIAKWNDAPAPPSASSSQSSSISAINPHINPLIFDSPQKTPSTVASTLSTATNSLTKTRSSMKRAATVADLDCEDPDEGNGESFFSQ
ncbi:uncharacterized protein MELLADRAFT_60481 [Melampsora larici-populina 98AG31]|uniref:Uncharacterized protein n=1 Tax=Melampsora larici-populina (strain 98AG31 / pathotype 3-4-7) TaxID=747676 RepID=F4RBC1_MELLP|nr:uncharacterized protein MELLADRAFT_60481 [Melampsora larici-populina 98AG31]EGG10059.1 hypothetical protein MELLADRAFT_60481 [Melampsora larici-populina 98AG31]